jgi:hypothetical protein
MSGKAPIVFVIILVIAAIAVPPRNQQRMTAHEAAAIQETETVHAAEKLISEDLAEVKKERVHLIVQATATGYSAYSRSSAFNNSCRCTFYVHIWRWVAPRSIA